MYVRMYDHVSRVQARDVSSNLSYMTEIFEGYIDAYLQSFSGFGSCCGKTFEAVGLRAVTHKASRAVLQSDCQSVSHRPDQ